MYNRIDLKKIALLLVIVCVGSAVAACVLFLGQYGTDISSGTMFSDNMKNGTKVDVKKEEAVGEFENISVETVSEDIHFILTDSGEVTAHLNGSYYSSNKEDKPELIVERAGNTLTIKVEWSRKLHVLFFNNNLKLDVYLPKQYTAELKTKSSSGEIYAEGLTLERFTCEVTSGDINANGIKASEANVETTSGSTKLSGTFDTFTYSSTSGYLKAKEFRSKTSLLKSSSGTINVSGAPGDLDVKTTSGEIDLQYRKFANKLNVSSSSGEVTIRLPLDAGYTLDAGSSSGSIACDFPITTSESRDDHKLNGTVGDGKGNISVRTTSGEITLTK